MMLGKHVLDTATNMTRIEFVYFDLGNILVSFDPEIACRNVADLTGVSTDTARHVIYESGAEARYERGELTSRQFADYVRDSFGFSEEQFADDALLDAIADMFSPIESMVRVAALARERAGRIGVLSNTCPAHWDWVRRQPWEVSMIDFDVQILSYKSMSMKPDAVIYEHAEQAALVDPNRILFIDDKEENVEAAKGRGWNAEQCLGGEQAESVIKKWLRS